MISEERVEMMRLSHSLPDTEWRTLGLQTTEISTSKSLRSTVLQTTKLRLILMRFEHEKQSVALDLARLDLPRDATCLPLD